MIPLSLRLALVALLLLGVNGCAHVAPRLDAIEELHTPAGAFRIESVAGDPGAPRVVAAIEVAAPRLRRWGQLREQVVVKVMPDHESLERAVGRSDYPWLRAWARYRVVYIQSPASWPNSGASVAQVGELMLHELTHCLMYQQGSTEEQWQRKRIPVWFREGMASVTAGQGYRRGSFADLQTRLADQADPLDGSVRRYRAQSHSVYSAAHHAFAFLVQRYGDEAIGRLLVVMREGARFDEAFSRAIGIERQVFEREFRQFIAMQGWRARPN